MNDGAYAGLRRAPRASASDPCDDENLPEDEDDTDEAKGKKKENKTMSNPNPAVQAANLQGADAQTSQAAIDQAVTVARAETQANERQRISAVFASEDVKGRECAAAELLANSDMPADRIIAMLPKLAPAASAAQDEGVAMLNAMRDGGDSNLGVSGEDQNLQAANNFGWDEIHEEIRARR